MVVTSCLQGCGLCVNGRVSGLTEQSEDTGEDAGGGGSAEADRQQWGCTMTAGATVSGDITGADNDGQHVGAAERRTAAI